MFVCVYVSFDVRMHVNIKVCMYTWMDVCMCVCMYEINLCMHYKLRDLEKRENRNFVCR